MISYKSKSKNNKIDLLIRENEADANLIISDILLKISFFYLLVGVLSVLGVFKLNSLITWALFISILLFVSIALFCKRVSSEVPWLKYIQVLLLLFSIAFINAGIGYKIWLLFSVPVFLSVRFYNQHFTIIIGIFAVLLTIASSFTNSYLAPFLGIMDLNLISFGESGVLEYYSWLFNAVIKHGYDQHQVIINGLKLSSFPNSIAIIICILVAMSLIHDAEQKLIKLSDSYNLELELMREARTDELTGLYNRRSFEKHLASLSDNEIDPNLVYIAFDLNELKRINDSLGHAAGDEIIVAAANCIQGTFGPYGKVYRTGGDEYVAIITADTLRLNKLKQEFTRSVDSWSGSLVDSLSVSYGCVAKRDADASATINTIALAAEKLMYEAKSDYYRKQGVDRRGQQDAHKALCNLYTKILRINLTDDSYQIINMNEDEQTIDKGFSDKISTWLSSFGKTGQVHPDDLDDYLKLTDLNYMKSYFSSDKTSLHIFYRRKYDDIFKYVMMEIVPTNDFSSENQSLFLYVKNIDK